MDSDWMAAVTYGLANAGIRVVRFEFPYMAARRTDGRRRPPDRQPVLLDVWRNVIAAYCPGKQEEAARRPVVIGGKSMGGRMASMVADAASVSGLVCLGYPFHPPGKPERMRTEHLEALRTPALICQGTRDTMGGRDTVAGLTLSPAIRLHWLEDGDHGFKPRKASGLTEAGNIDSAVAETARFILSLPAPEAQP